MRFQLSFLLIFLLGILLPATTFGTVYINRVLNPIPGNPCNYGLNFYQVMGSEVWDANYQNAYGACAGLPPGPPFILESTVRVYGSNLEVQGDIEANWQIHVDSGGVFRLLNGVVQLNSVNILAQNGAWVDLQSATIIGTGVSTPLSINFGGKLSMLNCQVESNSGGMIYAFVPDSVGIDNCTFQSTGLNPATSRMLNVTGNFNPISFELTNSTFSTTKASQDYISVITTPKVIISGNSFGPTTGYGLNLGSLDSLILDNNQFTDILCPGPISPNCGPVNLNDSDLISMRGNSGSGCTFNGIRMAFAGGMGAEGTARINSTPGFPLVLNTAMIIGDGDSLIIEPNTVMKLGQGNNFIVNGHLVADQVLFTSERDTTADGNTTQLFGPSPGDWRGILIDGQAGTPASGTFTNCTFRYAGQSNFTLQRASNASLTIEGCSLELGTGIGLWLQDASETEPQTFAHIVQNTIRRMSSDGIYNGQLFPTNASYFRNNYIIGNGTGINLWGSNHPVLDGNLIAGNKGHGVRVQTADSPFLVNNVVAANGGRGIFFELAGSPAGDSARVLNNHLIGNGSSGLAIANGSNDLAVINNLLAYNQGYGIDEFSPFAAENPYRNNAFWDNSIGAFWDNNATLLTPGDLNQQVPSAQNQSLNPQLVVIDSGSVQAAFAIPASEITRIDVVGGSLIPNTLANHLFWNQNTHRFHLILSNSATRIILADTTTSILPTHSFRVVDPEQIASPSPLADAGELVYYLPAQDYLGSPRVQQLSVDIGAFESANIADPCPPDSVLFVDGNLSTGADDGSSWSDAKRDLQEALDLVESGACPAIREIWVREGVYLPSPADRTIAFEWLAGVKVYGSFPQAIPQASLEDRDWINHPSILSGNIGDEALSSDNAYQVIKVEGQSGKLHLDGFLIKGANAQNDNGIPSLGAGMYVSNNQAIGIELVNCHFQYNTGIQGGAISVQNSQPVDLEVHQSNFHGNESVFSGGALSFTNLNPQSHTQALFVNCLFTHNVAQDSGGVVRNWASGTASIDLTFQHCTFFQNEGKADAGLDHSRAQLNSVIQTYYGNSILYDHSSTFGTELLRYHENASVRIDFSFLDVPVCDSLQVPAGNLECIGNMVFGGSPRFVDSANLNLRLQPNSPCIDSGDEWAVIYGFSVDYDYAPRFVAPDSDQGAYEFQGASSSADLLSSSSIQLFPNPSQELVYLKTEQLDPQKLKLSLRTITGQEIWRSPWREQFSVADLPKGVYLLLIEHPHGTSKHKMLVY